MMTRNQFLHLLLKGAFGLLFTGMAGCYGQRKEASLVKDRRKKLSLTESQQQFQMSLFDALAARRSKRSFTDQSLTEEEISQLFWAAQGITEESTGFRTAPSAGALYPLELYGVTKDGVYHYLPQGHQLEKTSSQDLRASLYQAALSQSAVKEAPMDIVITGVYERTDVKYGERAVRYVQLEAGHVAQNILLTAVALGLGGVPIGAFYDSKVQKVLSLPKDQRPLYVIPLGHPT